MRCKTSGCSQEASRECCECSRHFCSDHIEKCEWCQQYVCFECRDQHESNPMHEEAQE